jgi:hypothetical protein
MKGTIFILMAMKVHDAPRIGMDHLIRECISLESVFTFNTIDNREIICPYTLNFEAMC